MSRFIEHFAAAFGAADDCAEQQLKSYRLRILTTRGRLRRANQAAIATIETGGDKAKAEEAFKVAFVGPLAFLLIGIAWDIFWHWWTNRNK